MSPRGLGRMPCAVLAEHVNHLIGVAWRVRREARLPSAHFDRGYYESIRVEINSLQTLIRENMA